MMRLPHAKYIELRLYMQFYNGEKQFSGITYFHPSHYFGYQLCEWHKIPEEKKIVSMCKIEKLYVLWSWYSNEAYGLKLNEPIILLEAIFNQNNMD